MANILEILGRGLLAELAGAFPDALGDDPFASTEDLHRRIKQEPECVGARRALAIRLLREGRRIAARDAFRRCLAQDRNDAIARIGLACVLDELGTTRDAVAELELVRELWAGDGSVLFALGFCHEKLGERSAAVAYYRATADVAPHLRNVYERLAAISLSENNLERAIAQYEHICGCEPDDVAARLLLAGLSLWAGQYEDAVHHYQFAVTIEPDNWDARDEAVSACIETGRFEEAVAVLDALIQRRPECADPHLHLGEVYEKMGRHAEAVEAYARAIEINPDYLEATVRLGAARLREGCYLDAAAAFHRAIELNDRVVEAYACLSAAHEALGSTEEAAEMLALAADIEPNSTLLFSELARVHGKISAASQDCHDIFRHDAAPPASDGPCGEAPGLIQRQIWTLRASLHRHPYHADWHYRLGLLLRSEGQLPEGITALRRALAIDPDYQQARVKLALTLREAGRGGEAVTVLTRALSCDRRRVDLYYQLGLLFADKNEFSLALERFDAAVKPDRYHLDYLANLSLALQHMGLLDRAAEGWQCLCDAALRAPASYLCDDAERPS